MCNEDGKGKCNCKAMVYVEIYKRATCGKTRTVIADGVTERATGTTTEESRRLTTKQQG